MNGECVSMQNVCVKRERESLCPHSLTNVFLMRDKMPMPMKNAVCRVWVISLLWREEGVKISVDF